MSTETSDFRVEWVIDAENCEGPIAAAKYAQAMQQRDRTDYWCGVFHVVDDKGNRFQVDLDVPEKEIEAVLMP